MSMKAVVSAAIVASFAAATAIAQTSAPLQAEGKTMEGISAGNPLSATQIQVMSDKEKAEAEETYKETLDVVSQARQIGDEGQAYLLYTDALLKLRKLRGQYPDFKTKEIDAKIEEVASLLTGLEDAKCQSLEDEKAGRFRFLVWKRQILILDRIDKLQKATDANNEMLEDIEDKLGI